MNSTLVQATTINDEINGTQMDTTQSNELMESIKSDCESYHANRELLIFVIILFSQMKAVLI